MASWKILLGFCHARSWLTDLQCSARLSILTLNNWTVQTVVPFSNWGVLECDIGHRRSVAVLGMLYDITCNPMQPLYGALPLPYVPGLVTRGVPVAHRYTFIPISVSIWNGLADPVFDGVGRVGFKSSCRSLFVFFCFSLSLLSVYTL